VSRPRCFGVIAAGLACVSLLAASPAAAASFTTPVEVSEAAVETNGPQLGIDDAGDVTAAWVSVNSYPTGQIKSAYLPAGGTWQPIQTPISTTTCERPSLAVNASGAAVLVADCGAGKMRAAFRAGAGAAWGSPVEVTGSENATEPDAAIDDSGNAIFIWDREETIQSSYRPASTGVWGSAQSISAAGVGSFPDARIAMNSTGLAVAAWSNKESASAYAINAKMRSPGELSTWGAFKRLSSMSGEAFSPEIALNTEGLIVAWEQRVSAERFVLNNAWGGGCNSCGWGEDAASHQAGTTDRSVSQPSVAIDAHGRATAVWRAEEVPTVTGQPGVQSATTASINGLWSAPATLLSAGTSPYVPVFAPPPQVAADDAGNATAVWPTNEGVYAARRAPGGAFEGAVPISNANSVETSVGTRFPTPVAMDPGGDSFAAWTAAGGGRRLVFAMRDGTPPTLSGIGVPISGETGQALAMSASATDTWSSPVTIHWDFGDGSSATGTSVSHAYASAGTKTVTITATDAAGNSTAAQTRQVVITQKPTQSSPVKLTVSARRQSWKAIAKAKGVKLGCTLDAQGTCSATATVSAAVAKRLGLGGKAKKPVKVGSGSVHIDRAEQATTLLVKLSSKARAAIAGADKNVLLSFAVTGVAPGHPSASKTKTLTVKRP
jgi:hypothetical protein